jgi:tRNA (guanine-N7-)-methyltransferase
VSQSPFQLPIFHPDYRYPQAKNPYSEKLKIFQGKVLSDQDTETHRGQWKSFFQKTHVDSTVSSDGLLHVELGCNAGHVIVEWAKQNPNHLYVGVDWKFKAIFKAAEKAEKRKLANLMFFRAHSERLQYMFAPQEIDRLYLFFPDPWPKKGHWKHRFITEDRLKELKQLMKPGGVFHIKTDHRGYFDWMMEAIEKSTNEWEIIEHSMDLHKDHPYPESLNFPEVTLFEKIFIREKLPIHSVKLRARI